MSDLHIEYRHTEDRLIKKELKDHAENNRDVFLNGDVFDLILPKDAKRYSRGAHKDGMMDEIINSCLDQAVNLFSDYPNIKGIGIGNHEASSIRYGGVNIVKLLIDRLEKDCGFRPKYMGYTGAIVYKFDYCPQGKRCGGWRWICHYHHGAGGAAKVTKGIMALYHMGAWSPGADLIWQGHKHNRILDSGTQFLRIGAGGNCEWQHQARVMTGAYMKPSPSVPGYAQAANMSPQQPGGATVRIELTRPGPAFGKETRVTL
jgi:hypothetical protein